MPNLRTVKEYKEEKLSHGNQWFLGLYTFPFLLTPNTHSSPKPEGVGNSGFYTKDPNDSTAPSGQQTKKSTLIITDGFLAIPVVKVEGHPFPERIGVGRTKGTDITLPDREVSKYQGYFSVSADRWSFTDGGSSNGTFIRGERRPPMVETALEDGTEIRFGSGRYLFRTAAGFCEFLGR